jgi:micrococcal nuclease
MTEKCPTCGSDVTVGGEGSTHFYIPVVNYSPYVYKAYIKEVFDGDTCTATVDLGMRVSMDIKIRLYGINAPEMRGGDKGNGVRSREYLRNLILGKDVIIKTYKDKTEKFGRWLAEIFVDDQNVNQVMVQDGYAKKYDE